MPIVVKVVEQDEYDLWINDKKAAAIAMAELTEKDWSAAELVERGESLYVTNCVACHQVNGQGIAGIFPGLAGSDVVLNDFFDVEWDIINNVIQRNDIFKKIYDC